MELKLFIIGISFFMTTGVNAAVTSDICLAQKSEVTSYGGTMQYKVECSDGTKFDSPQIVTMVFLPLPYHWGNAARSKLRNMMIKKGYSQISDDQHSSNNSDVFEKTKEGRRPKRR